MKVKLAVGWILDWSCKPLDRQEALALAGIHTTLVALLVACLSAYVAFVYTTVQQAELKTFEEAEKVNTILFLIHQCPYGIVSKAEAHDKHKLIDMMFKINAGIDDPSIPSDVDGRTEKALGIMHNIVNQYPFAAPEGEPITFANLDEVKAWIDSMHKTTRVFTLEFLGVGRLLALLKEFGKSTRVSDERDMILKSPLLGPMAITKLVHGFGTHVTLEGLDPVIVYYDFVNRISEAMSIVRTTQNHVKHADALIRRYPSRLNLQLLYFLVLVAFGCGVVYPLAATKVCCVFALWLPFFIYVLIGGLVVRVIF
jgi:hypothetical protein